MRLAVTLVAATLLAACSSADDQLVHTPPTEGVTTEPSEPDEPIATETADDSPSDDATPEPVPTAELDVAGVFDLDGVEYSVNDVCREDTGDGITYRALMVEEGGGRGAFDLVIVDDNPSGDPDNPDVLAFELYGPGDGDAQFSGSASHTEDPDVSYGEGTFDQGDAFSYAIDLGSAAAC